MAQPARTHTVAIVIGDKQIDGWTEYVVDSSMLEAADAFTLTRPVDRAAWQLCRRDARVRVTVDGVIIVDGFIDSREAVAADGTMTITGRDKAGRLVQESAPAIHYGGLSLVEVAKKLAEPWFSRVVLSDARNRRVRRGRGAKAPAPNEPLVLDSRLGVSRIEPGQMRWAVLEGLASQAGLLVWSAADGSELVIGRPNYGQAVQFLLHHAAPTSRESSTVKDLRIAESVADRYSRIVVMGSGAGTDANYGSNVTARRAEARDHPADPEGVGRDFLHPKRLVLADDSLRSFEDAQRLADRERRRRDVERQKVTAVMPLHGQVIAGQAPTLFAPNTLARVRYDELGIDETFLIYACRYQANRSAGEMTQLELVPRGTELTL